jgi:hypothetical protein
MNLGCARRRATPALPRQKQKALASLQALDFLVAGEGFEPSTFGL